MASFNGSVERVRRDLVASGTDTTTARRLAPRIAEIHQQQADQAQMPYPWLGARGVDLDEPSVQQAATACEGAEDLCGAPAGQPCEPGCPSLATDEGCAIAVVLDEQLYWSTEQRGLERDIEEIRS